MPLPSFVYRRSDSLRYSERRARHFFTLPNVSTKAAFFHAAQSSDRSPQRHPPPTRPEPAGRSEPPLMSTCTNVIFADIVHLHPPGRDFAHPCEQNWTRESKNWSWELGYRTCPLEDLNIRFEQGRSYSAFLFSVATGWHLDATAYNPAPFHRRSHPLPPLHIW